MHVLDLSEDVVCLPCMHKAAALMLYFNILKREGFVKQSAQHETEVCGYAQSHFLHQASVCGAVCHCQLTPGLMVTSFMRLYLCTFCLQSAWLVC